MNERLNRAPDSTDAQHNSCVVIDYVVDGPRTAAAVAAGQTRLVGMSYVTAGEPPRFVANDLAEVIRGFGDRPRIYFDSVFSCALELQNGLPLPTAYDDVRVMLHLLEEEPPSELTDQGSSHNSSPMARRDASLARVQQSASWYEQLAPRIEAENLDAVYRRVELPAVAPTLAMTLSGLRVNIGVLEHIKASHSAQLDIGRIQMQELAGRAVNLDDSRDVARYLFEELGLPAAVFTPGGEPSAGKAALEPLVDRHPAVGVVLTYNQRAPVYHAAAALLSLVDQSSQRVFPVLDPLGAATGRFSCRSPNLQGLPSPLLEAVEADPGCLFLEADISQCELRVLAHFSRDARLVEAYTGTNTDIHRRTAAAALGIAEQQVTDEQRETFGKELNFAIIYGTGPVGLSKKLAIRDDEAQALLDTYFASYPGVRQWIDQVHRCVQSHGYVDTLCGRRRKLSGVWSADPGVKARALRQAVNTIIQGSAADLMKLALVRLHDVLPPEVQMLMTVHDSVLLQVPENLIDVTRSQTIAAMQMKPAGFAIPIRVDVGTGRTWAACKER